MHWQKAAPPSRSSCCMQMSAVLCNLESCFRGPGSASKQVLISAYDPRIGEAAKGSGEFTFELQG